MQEQITESIVARLKHAREQSGITLSQLALKTGYAQTTLSSVENLHDRPSNRLLMKWLEALNLSRRWVETGQGEMFVVATTANPVAGQDLAAPLHFRIQSVRRHAQAALEELDLLERELSTRKKTPKSR